MIFFSLVLILYVVTMKPTVYFYERYAQIRRFLPFVKRHVIYYDEMHVHIVKKKGHVRLNHYRTLPKFWESPHTWLKANFLDAINLPLNCDPKILEFVQTKALSVNTIKTPPGTTLSGNPHEQSVYELEQNKWLRWFAYYVLIPLNAFLWWIISLPDLIKEGTFAIVIVLTMPVIILLLSIICVVMISKHGDVYFYERHVETRGLFPFSKQKIIYYDKMHVHILKHPDWNGMLESIVFSYYKTPPKFWKSPYIWLKAKFSENIVLLFTYNRDPEIMEFIKAKAQSINYR